MLAFEENNMQHKNDYGSDGYPVVYAGCPVGTDAGKLHEPLTAEEKLLNDAEECSAITQSAECSEPASCTTVSAPGCASSKFEISAGTGEWSLASGSRSREEVAVEELLSYSDVACDTAVVEPAELTHELQTCIPDSGPESIASSADSGAVCMANSNPVDSTVVSCSATDQKTKDSSINRQSSSAEGKSSSGVGQCRHDGSIYGPSQKHSSQLLIQSFFKPVSKAEQQSGNAVDSVKNSGQADLLHSHDMILHGNSKVQTGLHRSTDSSCNRNDTVLSLSLHIDAGSEAVATGSSNITTKFKKCPFYKWIPGKLS